MDSTREMISIKCRENEIIFMINELCGFDTKMSICRISHNVLYPDCRPIIY